MSVLVLLRLPIAGIAHGQESTLILWCAMLALCGVGMAVIGSPRIIEASEVVQMYDEANKGFFGENGPYAQLYSFQSLTFSTGLALGPVLSGVLRDSMATGT